LIEFAPPRQLNRSAAGGLSGMADDMPMVERIRANAELVVSVATQQLGQAVGYDEAGVRWLDGYIQRQHEQGNPDIRGGLVSTLGSFLGECIVRSFGGEWAEVDGSWCVRFDDHNAAYPFAKVGKQLEHGAEGSVLSFFTAIPVLFRGRLKQAEPGAAPDPAAM
jgi:hypothetical protein